MFTFIAKRAFPDQGNEALERLDQWWDTHHASAPAYLVPGHLLMDGPARVICVVGVHSDHIEAQSITTWEPVRRDISDPNMRWRHPLSLDDAQSAVDTLPMRLRSRVDIVPLSRIGVLKEPTPSQ